MRTYAMPRRVRARLALGLAGLTLTGCTTGAYGGMDPTEAYLEIGRDVYPAATDGELLDLADAFCGGIDEQGGDANAALEELLTLLVFQGSSTDGVGRLFGAATAYNCPEYSDQFD